MCWYVAVQRDIHVEDPGGGDVLFIGEREINRHVFEVCAAARFVPVLQNERTLALAPLQCYYWQITTVGAASVDLCRDCECKRTKAFSPHIY